MNNKKHGAFHGLLMLLCCLGPLLAFMIFAPQLKNLAGGASLSWLILLLCPIMHIGMMFFMRDKGGSCHGHNLGSSENMPKEKHNINTNE